MSLCCQNLADEKIQIAKITWSGAENGHIYNKDHESLYNNLDKISKQPNC